DQGRHLRWRKIEPPGLKGSGCRFHPGSDTRIVASLRGGWRRSRLGRRLDLVLVLLQERVEALQGRVQRLRGVEVAKGEELLVEVPVVLKHVAHLVGAGEA